MKRSFGFCCVMCIVLVSLMATTSMSYADSPDLEAGSENVENAPASFINEATVVPPGPHYYSLPFSTLRVRVSRTGSLYSAHYTNAGLTEYGASEYHPGNNRGAIDFMLADGANVIAAAPGTVTPDTNSCQVVVKSDNGDLVYYIHHRRNGGTLVKAGEKVRRGQVIAKVGKDSACNAQGAHLHFAVWRAGKEIPVYFSNAEQQTSNRKTCPYGLICPSRTNYVEFRYPKQ